MEYVESNLINKLLLKIQQEFYRKSPQYYYDKKMLIYAITYPASWLRNKSLEISPEQYEKLIKKRISEIIAHGKPELYSQHFPSYLLKCIKKWLFHNGEDFYYELKHIRNSLCNVENLIEQIKNRDVSDNTTEILARTHSIIHNQYRKNKKRINNPKQLELF